MFLRFFWQNMIEWYLKFYKNKSDFFCDIFIFIFEKLGTVGPVKLKIKLVCSNTLYYFKGNWI